MNIFNPSKDTVWKEFADSIGGNFLTSGHGLWVEESGILARYKELEIKLDTYRNVLSRRLPAYTRIKTYYHSTSPINFTIRDKIWFDLLFGFLPHYEVKTDDREFNRAFSCDGSDELKLRKLLSFSIIRHHLKEISTLELKSRDKKGWGLFSTNFKAGTLELYLRVPGVVKDVEKLNRLYQLFTEVLDRLEEIDARTATHSQYNDNKPVHSDAPEGGA